MSLGLVTTNSLCNRHFSGMWILKDLDVYQVQDPTKDPIWEMHHVQFLYCEVLSDFCLLSRRSTGFGVY